MEPSPKPAAEPVIEEEDEEDGGDESEALLGGSSNMGKSPDISASSAVKIIPSKDTVKVESEPTAKPAIVGARAKKPYLNTDV